MSEETKGRSYPLTIWSGLITAEHRKRMGPAIWEFLWMVDKITREENGRGFVLGGKVIACAEIAGDLGIDKRTAWVLLRKLQDAGYIELRRRQSGFVITVLKSKKWRSRWNRPELASPSYQNLKNARSESTVPSIQNPGIAGSPRSHDMYIDNNKDTERNACAIKTGSKLLFEEIDSLPEAEKKELESEAVRRMASTPWGSSFVSKRPEGVELREGAPAKTALKMIMQVIHSERRRGGEAGT